MALFVGLLKSLPLSLSGEIPVLSFVSDLIKFKNASVSQASHLPSPTPATHTRFSDDIDVMVNSLPFQFVSF